MRSTNRLNSLGLACLLAALGLLHPVWAGVAEGERPKPIQVGGDPAPEVKITLPAEAPKTTAAAAEGAPAPLVETGEDEKPIALYQRWKALEPQQIVPDKSVVYAAIKDYSKAKDAFFRSALRSLIKEPEVGEPLHATWERLINSYRRGDGTLTDIQERRRKLEVDVLNELESYFEHQVALSVDFVQVQRPGQANPQQVPRFLLVFSLPKTERGELRMQELTDLFDRFSASQLIDRRYKDRVTTVGPYRIQQLVCDELDLEEGWAFVENLFVYARGPGLIEEALKAYHTNQGKGTLSQNAGYASTYGKVGEDAHVFLQVDAMSMLKPVLQDNLLLARYWGIDLAQAENAGPQAAVGLKVLDGDNAAIKEKWLLRFGKQDEAVQGTCRSVSAYLAPSNALFFGAQQFSFAPFIKQLSDNAADAPPNDPSVANLRKFINGLQTAMGAANFEEVVRRFDPFKGEVSVQLSYIPGGQNLLEIFQPILAVEFNRADLAEISNTLEKLRQASGMTYKKLTYHDAEVWYQVGAMPGAEGQGQQTHGFLEALFAPAAAPGQKVEKQVGTPFFVGYALVSVTPKDGEQGKWFVLFSDSVKALKKAIQQGTVHRHSLAQRDEFKSLSDQFDAQRYNFNFLDLPRVTEAMYRQILPELSRMSGSRNGLFELLPPENVVVPHLSAMGWAKTVHNEGLLMEFVSPTGNLSLGGLIGAFALPRIQAERQMAVSRQAEDNFKRLNLGLHLYAADFDRFPVRLSDLHPNYVSEFSVFESPFKKGAVRSEKDIDDIEKTNLVYVPGRPLQDMSDQILLFEVRPAGIYSSLDGEYRTVHHVLQLDGRVRGIPASRLRQLLKDVRGLPKELDLQPGAKLLQPGGTFGTTGAAPSGAGTAPLPETAGENSLVPMGPGRRPTRK